MRYKQAYYESLHIQTILIAKITVFTSAVSVTAVNSMKRLKHPHALATSSATQLIWHLSFLLRSHILPSFTIASSQRSPWGDAGHKQGRNQTSYSG